MRIHTALKCVVPIEEDEVEPVLYSFASLFSVSGVVWQLTGLLLPRAGLLLT